MTQISTGELQSLVVCPQCNGDIANGSEGYDCLRCGLAYEVVDGIPVLIPGSTEDSKRHQATWFDEQVDEEFEITRPHGTPALYQWFYQLKFDHATSRISPWVAGRLVLTVCGGSGMDAEFLARRGARVISSDISLRAAVRTRERARRYGLDVTPIVADAERLPFPNRSMDLVLVHDGLHHLERPFFALREMARVARYAVSITEPADALATAVAVRLGLALEVEDSGNEVARLRLGEVRDVLHEEGFTVREARRYAMYHKHEPGRMMSVLSHGPALSATKTCIRTLNAALGGMGNKLVVQGVRPQSDLKCCYPGRGERVRELTASQPAACR